MKQITVMLDEDTWKKLKIKCVQDGHLIKQYITQLIIEGTGGKNANTMDDKPADKNISSNYDSPSGVEAGVVKIPPQTTKSELSEKQIKQVEKKQRGIIKNLF